MRKETSKKTVETETTHQMEGYSILEIFVHTWSDDFLEIKTSNNLTGK